MLKPLKNLPIMQALSPWTTKDNQELVSLFPQIITKKKKKKTKKQNIQNQLQHIKKPVPKNSSPIPTNPNQMKEDYIRQMSKSPSLPNPISKKQDKQNDLNFIKKSKKIKNEVSNRQVLCPKPPTSQRKYVRSSNYVTLSDEINTKNFPRDQLLFKEINNTQICKSDDKNIKDIHSLYLIEKLKGISNNYDTIKHNQASKAMKLNKASPNPFLQYISSQNHGSKHQERKILTQRGPRLYNVKTQVNDIEPKNSIFKIKKGENIGCLSHKMHLNNYSILRNEVQKCSNYERQNFNLETTFAQQSIILTTYRQNEQSTLKASPNKSNLLKIQKPQVSDQILQNNIDNQFSGIKLGYKKSIILPLKQSSELNEISKSEMKSTNLPTIKEKMSMIIQKSQFSVKQRSNQKQIRQQNVLCQSNRSNMDRQIKRNLRKLRGYLVKKTRDNCMEKGNLDENQLLMYETNINYFTTQ